MLAALRYRRAQTLVVVVLAALVTTCLVLAPLYTRALEQAMIRTMLREATVAQTGLRLGSTSPTAPQDALDPDALEQLLPGEPADLRRVADPQHGRRRAPAAVRRPAGWSAAQPGGHVRPRDDSPQGQCPSARGEVAVSADQVKAYETPVGSHHRGRRVRRRGQLARGGAAHDRVRVVGVYEQVDGPYWFGDRLTGSAAQKLGFDTMLTPLQTLTDPVTSPKGTPAPWFQPVYGAGLPAPRRPGGHRRDRGDRRDHHRARPVPHGGRAGRQPCVRDDHGAERAAGHRRRGPGGQRAGGDHRAAADGADGPAARMRPLARPPLGRRPAPRRGGRRPPPWPWLARRAPAAAVRDPAAGRRSALPWGLCSPSACRRSPGTRSSRPTRRSRSRWRPWSPSWPACSSWSGSPCSRSGGCAATRWPTSSAASRRGAPASGSVSSRPCSSRRPPPPSSPS